MNIFRFLAGFGTTRGTRARVGRAPRRLALEVLESRLNPSAAANQVFNLYQSFLDRVTEEPALSTWSVGLERGQISVGQMADQILHSPEYATRAVTAYYNEYLHRATDTAGLAAHVWALQNGSSQSQVIAAILASDEYFARQGAASIPFVESLYTSVLGRPSEPAGLDANVAALERGASRASVALAFLTSPEYGRNLATYAYLELLGRNASPGEQQAWAQVVTGRADGSTLLLAAIAGSPEGGANLGTTDPTPGAARNVVLKNVGQDTMVVSWDQPVLQSTVGGTNPAAHPTKYKGATSYTVTVDNGVAPPTTYSPTIATWTSIKGLSPSGSYTVTVTAHNASGSGPATRAISVPVPPASANVWDIKKSSLPQESTGPGGNLVIPAGSSWGNRLGFPAIPYDTIMAAPGFNPTAPSLSLPIDVSKGLVDGASVTMWVQATGPGMLLSAKAQGADYTIPYLWIDADGKVNGGLYGPGAVTPASNGAFTILTSTGAGGANFIGSPLAITSQVSVVDNNWHHIAFVANQSGQQLYVDGLLQGIIAPNYVEDFFGLATSSSSANYTSNQIIIQLAEAPKAGTPFDALVYQGSPSSGSPAQQANQTFTLSGIVPNSTGKTLSLSCVSTGIQNSGKGTNGTIDLAKVTSATLEGTTLTLCMGNAVQAGSAAGLISVSAAYQVPGGVFSFAPTIQSTEGGAAKTDLTSALVTMGGTVNPASVTTSLNFPQPLIAAVDEVAYWNQEITQADIQQVMTQPVSKAVNGTTFPNGYSAPGVPGPALYFDFNSTSSSFASQPPANTTALPAIATGLDVGVGNTIPTSPFGNIERVGQFVNIGIGIMSPLASGNIPAPTSATTNPPATAVAKAFQVALAQGDLFAISRPAGSGKIRIAVTDDLGQKLLPTIAGQASFDGVLGALETLDLTAPRTGSYLFTLEYEATAAGTSLAYCHTPGSQNSFQRLFNTFEYYDSNSGNNTIYSAYLDPSLPAVMPSNINYAQGPGNYFPIWTDNAWFPQSFSSSELSSAYTLLVSPIIYPSLDFANLNGANLANAGQTWNIANWVQQQLNAYYTIANDGNPAPPAPPSGYLNPTDAGYSAPATALEAVYQFLYNTNLARIQISETLNQIYTDIATTAGAISTGSPAGSIATTISSNQSAFVTGESVSVPVKSTQQNMGAIARETAVSTGIDVAAHIAAEAGGNAAFAATYFGLNLLLGFMKQQNPTNTPQNSLYVSFVPVMQTLLNYEALTELGSSIDGNMVAFLDNVATCLSSQNFLTSIFSNSGLMTAMQSMSVTNQQGQSGSLTQAAEQLAGEEAWRSMIPATFTWNQVLPADFPSGNISNGTFGWATTQPDTTTNAATEASFMTTGDFNNDHFPDLAISNTGSGTISILLAQPKYSGGTAPLASNGDGYVQGWDYSGSSSFGSTTNLNLPSQSGIGTADFNRDGNNDILVNSDTQASIAFGNGSGVFQAYESISLSGANSAEQLVIADFNGDSLPDFATGCYDGSIVIGINTTPVTGIKTPATNFTTPTVSSATTNLPNATSFTAYKLAPIGTGGVSSNAGTLIAVGDFNDDGNPDLVALNMTGLGYNILQNAGLSAGGEWSGFNPPNYNNGNNGLQGGVVLDPAGLAVGDFNGDGNDDDLAIVGPNQTSDGSGTDHLYLVTNAGASSPGWGGPYNGMAWSNATGVYSGIATIPGGLLQSRSPATSTNTVPDGLVIGMTTGTYILYDPSIYMNNTVPYTLPPSGLISNSGLNNGVVCSQVVVDPSGMIAAVFNDYNVNTTTTVGWSNNVVTNNPIATYVPGGLAQQAGAENPGSVVQKLQSGQGGQVTAMPVSANGLQTLVASPGFFLGAVPAAIKDTAGGIVSTGDMILGWQLLDGLGNPIALDTLAALFGTPTASTIVANAAPILPNLWSPGDVVPANAVQPVMALNNGWFLDTKPFNNAPATWADAFFGWGSNVPGYSPRNLLPTLSSSETALPTGINFAINGGFTARLGNGGSFELSPALETPPSLLFSSVPLKLSATGESGAITLTWDPPASSSSTVEGYIVNCFQGTTSQRIATSENFCTFAGLVSTDKTFFTVQPKTHQGTGQVASLLVGAGPDFSPYTTDGLGVGIVQDGTPFTGGGFDGNGNAYSAQAMNASPMSPFWGTTFRMGTANQPNFIRATGQPIQATITGSNLVTIAAAAVNGAQRAQFTVHFTDGTTAQTATQSFSDWTSPSNFSNETILSTQKYCDTTNGSSKAMSTHVYGYSFMAPPGKTLQSITLPNATNLNILDIQFGKAVSATVSLPYNGYGIANPPKQLPNYQGFNGEGLYYNGQDLGSAASSGEYTYNYGAAGNGGDYTSNFVKCYGQVIGLPGKTVEVSLAGAVWGNSTAPGNVTLNFTDGTNLVVSSIFGPWLQSNEQTQNNTGDLFDPGSGIILQPQNTFVRQDGNTNMENSPASCVFMYNYQVPYGKTLQSVTLPDSSTQFGLLAMSYLASG